MLDEGIVRFHPVRRLTREDVAVVALDLRAAWRDCSSEPVSQGGTDIRRLLYLAALAVLACGVRTVVAYTSHCGFGTTECANYYRVALVTKYTLAGLPLGWIFWRWGLPYAILCHVAANAANLALQGGFF